MTDQLWAKVTIPRWFFIASTKPNLEIAKLLKADGAPIKLSCYANNVFRIRDITEKELVVTGPIETSVARGGQAVVYKWPIDIDKVTSYALMS